MNIEFRASNVDKKLAVRDWGLKDSKPTIQSLFPLLDPQLSFQDAVE
jgi:hypothetical protein